MSMNTNIQKIQLYDDEIFYKINDLYIGVGSEVFEKYSETELLDLFQNNPVYKNYKPMLTINYNGKYHFGHFTTSKCHKYQMTDHMIQSYEQLNEKALQKHEEYYQQHYKDYMFLSVFLYLKNQICYSDGAKIPEVYKQAVNF